MNFCGPALGFSSRWSSERPKWMDAPGYAVCESCDFLRAFAESVGDDVEATLSRCPACGREVRIHGREERFPSTYVGRISRELYATPPLKT
jgi:hypothetical protein